jgi:heme/copper-type cytochrome/quinol oxidase subunit 1
MRRVRSWGLAQRIILVVALALAFAVLGRYLVSLGGIGHHGNFGWYAYAPLNSSSPVPSGGTRPWLRVLVWLGLIAVWAMASARLLRAASKRRPQERPPLS